MSGGEWCVCGWMGGWVGVGAQDTRERERAQNRAEQHSAVQEPKRERRDEQNGHPLTPSLNSLHPPKNVLLAWGGLLAAGCRSALCLGLQGPVNYDSFGCSV